jgi:hypothetical protein
MTRCPYLSLKLRLQLIDAGDLQQPVIAEHGSPPSSARGDFRGSPPTFCAKFQMIYA